MADTLFLDRELSWLRFNERVLCEAADEQHPILERLRFHTIFTSNLDEYFMKRVGGLQNQVRAGVGARRKDQIPPRELLKEIRSHVEDLVQRQCEIFNKQLRPELKRNKIDLLSWKDLNKKEKAFSTDFFQNSVFPVLTPLSVDPGHPFPFISNLSVSVGILMRHPKRNEELFARMKVPTVFPSWIALSPEADGEQPHRFLSLFEIISKNLDRVFPGMEIIDSLMFRVTRNADVAIGDDDDDDAEDLLELVAEGLRERRFARVVRLETGPDTHPKILSVLTEELELNEKDIYQLPMGLEYFGVDNILEVNEPALKFRTWVPVMPLKFADAEQSIFDVIRKEDVLVHHPYESFRSSVERFVEDACTDPKVIAIKMTMYRTGIDSPFIPLLIRAAEAGKQVACLVELQARFDEERNIIVAQKLERAGVHVVYGVLGLKTHCKIALVVRQELDGVRTYAHIGSGNYNARTANLYTDLGIFTAKPDFTQDVVNLFHYLTGRAAQTDFKRLLVAPYNMKEPFLEMIRNEIKTGQGHIIAKMNSLEDPEMILALYEAAGQGVKIDLIVRGLCCLRVGAGGSGKNIRVVSVIGRFLEHARIFYFKNGAKDPLQGNFFMGSADWMSRNLNSRVEAIVPVEDQSNRERIWEILQTHLNDRRQAWEMKSNGTYVRPRNFSVTETGTHQKLMRSIREAIRSH